MFFCEFAASRRWILGFYTQENTLLIKATHSVTDIDPNYEIVLYRNMYTNKVGNETSRLSVQYDACCSEN